MFVRILIPLPYSLGIVGLYCYHFLILEILLLIRYLVEGI